MNAITEDNQSRDFRLDDQDLDNLCAKAEAAMPFLKDGHSTYAIQRHTRNVLLTTAGTNRKYFAALLSLPIDGREGTFVAYIIIHVIASLVVLMELRGPPMISGTIEDILSGEELEFFMRIVFEHFKDIFYIENNLIDSAENVVYMMILLNIRTMCNTKNGLVDPVCVSSWSGLADVLKNKRGFASRYYSFLTPKKLFRITFDHKKHHNEYLVIYRKERGDLRSKLYSQVGLSEFEQALEYEYGHTPNYREITHRIFMSFKRPEQSIEDVPLYYPAIACTSLEMREIRHERDLGGEFKALREMRFEKSHADALTAFLNERGINAQRDAPPAQQEDALEFLNQDPDAIQSGRNGYIDVSSVSAIDATEDALLESDDEVDPPDVAGEGELPTESADGSGNDVEDDVEDDVDLEIESDVVTFENAAFVFLEALKRKLKERMDKFEFLTLELFHLFIKYGISSLTQANANDHANTVMGENPLKAVEVLREFTTASFMKTAKEVGSSLSSDIGLFDDEEDDHEMNETIVAPEYDFEKTKGATHGEAASKMIIEKSRFIEKFANNMIRVLIKLGLVQVFPVCTNLCTVDSDVTNFTKEDEPTKWTCPFCQKLNDKLQPGSFSSRSQQLVFMISPRLHIACLFEDPSTSNVILQNCSKYHCTDEDTSHTFYNGEYVKRMKQFKKRTQLSNEREPQISNTKYFDESEIQLAVTLGWDGVAMFSKSVAQLKEPRELWPLVMRLVDFNSNTDFQLVNFPSIHRKKASVDPVGNETSEEDDGNTTPSMLNTEMTNTKILLSCVTDEFVRIQRKGILVKNHTSNSGDSPVLTVFATVVNFFGDLPALTKIAGLRGTAGTAPCLSCNEVKEKVKDPQKLLPEQLPVTVRYNKFLSLEKDGSSISVTEKLGIEFEHLKHYVDNFENEGPIRKKARKPFSITASLAGNNGTFLQKDAEFREVLKRLCQWVKIPAEYCNPDKHEITNFCNDSTHMRLNQNKLEELFGIVSLDIGSCTPIYDFDLSMGQNRIIGFDVMHCLCENLFPKMLRLLSESKDRFLLQMRYALPAPILKNLMTALQSSLGASDIWPSEFGEPPTLVDTFDVYLKAEQAQQLISLLPALLSADYYSRYLDPHFLKFFQLFAKMSKFLLGHNITKSEIPILESTIKEFCSLHRYLFYERHQRDEQNIIETWLFQAQNDRGGPVSNIATTSESYPHEIPEVKLMVRMGSIYFHILIHVMTLVKEYGHSNLFSCYGLERSMGAVKYTNNSTNKIITSTGRNMISRSISNCLSLAVTDMNCSQTSLLSRPSTDVKRNITGRHILTLAKPIAQFDVTHEAFGRPSFNLAVADNSKTVEHLLKLTNAKLSEDHLTIMNSVGGLVSEPEQLEDEVNKLGKEYLSKMTGCLMKWITKRDIPQPLELANSVLHSTKLYDRLLDGVARHLELVTTDEAGSLSLYVIRDHKMPPCRNPTTMHEIYKKWEAITGKSIISKTLKKKLKYLVQQATNDSDMRFHHSQCSVTESSKCETNVFTLEMPFLIGPGANEEVIDPKKFVFAHINEDVIAYLRKRFPRQFVKSCSSPSESIVPATLSVLERIIRDQNIEKVYRVWSPDLPNPGEALNVSLCDLLYHNSNYVSVFNKSACVIRSFQGGEEKPRYKLAIILQLFDMKWHKKPLSRASVIKTMRRRHITSALALVSDMDIEPIHVMPSSHVVSGNGSARTEEETDRENRSAIGLRIRAKAEMALCPLLLDHIDEEDPRSSWLSDSADSDDHAFDPSKSSALISLSSVIVGKAGLLFHGESKPMNPKSGFIQIQMSNFNQFEFLAHNEL